MYEDLDCSFFDSHIKYKNERFYYKKNSKWVKSDRHRTYFEFKNIIKDQILNLTDDKLSIIKELIGLKKYYIDKEYMCDVGIDKFLYIDDKIIFLQER